MLFDPHVHAFDDRRAPPIVGSSNIHHSRNMVRNIVCFLTHSRRKFIMKALNKIALLAVALVCAGGSASAQIFAFDSGTNYNSGWNNGDNNGFGFSPWALANTNVNGQGYSGFYIGQPGGGQGGIANLPGGNAFSMYAHGGASNAAVAFRAFTNSLTTNQVFRMLWANHGIGGSTANRAGFSLRHADFTDDFDDGVRFGFYYIGGGQDSFVIEDGNGVTAVGLGYGSGPFELEFTLEGSDTYRFVIKDPTGSTILYQTDGQPLEVGNNSSFHDTIDSLACYALNTDGDQSFNNITISSTSLVPPTIANVTPANGSIFVDPSQTNVSFEVDSAFSTVSPGGITLLLNGVAQTNLTVSSVVPTTSLQVSNNARLQPDAIYNATIIATDAHGNRVTNNFSFNTWITNLFFIEAEDYNFNQGGFIPDPDPNSFGASSGLALLGTNGIDYFKPDPAGAFNAGAANIYRPGDLVDVDAPPTSADVDHDNFVSNGYTDYNLSFIQFGEWENYTRKFTTSTAYAVYARIASFSGQTTMELDQDAATTATGTNQARVALGTFVSPFSGGPQAYEFVPLKDIFSSNVLVHFSSTSPTTLRCTALGTGYNFNYLIFVPVTNTATLKPFISFGFPFPNAVVAPESFISFTIANRQTAVNPSSIKVLLNSNDVTSGITLSNNAAGTVVSYVPPALLTPNSTNTLTAIFSDNGGTVTTVTNTWQFTVNGATIVTLPGADAQPLGSVTIPGFAIHIAKAPDSAPDSDFPNTLARAELQLLGLVTNSNGVAYANLATNGSGSNFYAESNTVNYDITGFATGSATFATKSPFPYVPAAATNDLMAMAAETYLQLGVGQYVVLVRSDDNFQLTCGPTPANTNFYIAAYDNGRNNAFPTTMYLNVTNAGLYPMRLLYGQGRFGGNVEFYSLDRSAGNAPVLINDRSNAHAILAFQAPPAGAAVTIQNVAHNGNVTAFSFATQSSHSYLVRYKITLGDASWQTLTNVTGNGATALITDPGASNGSRFYQVETQ